MRRDLAIWACALGLAASGCRDVLGIEAGVPNSTTDRSAAKPCEPSQCPDAAGDADSPDGGRDADTHAAGSGGAGAAVGEAGGGGDSSGRGASEGGAGDQPAEAGGGAPAIVAAGSGGDCSPQAERCDNADNDCDGSIDEALTQSCGRQTGECQGGSQLCEAGSWGACKGEKEPSEEQCDDASRDENCDGSSNEGCACTSGASQGCGSEVGACQPGTQTCRDGLFESCSGAVGPSAETCDGIDNDCDGKTDEALTQACGSSVGSCRQGLQACEAGNWGACSGGTAPATESCDAAHTDEDCDGSANEGCTCSDGQTRNCGSNVGACRFGSEACVNGQWNGQCTGGQGPNTETCDAGNLDEDCDGSANEGCACTNGTSESCGSDVGTCQPGSRACSGGVWGACAGGQGPVKELCDAALQDEDCDGAANNGCECTIGSKRCQGAQPQLCSSEGRWQDQSACSSAQFCSSGACVAKQQYTRGNDSMVGGAVQEAPDTLYAMSFSIPGRVRLLRFGLLAPANLANSFVRFALYSNGSSGPAAPLGASMEVALPTAAGSVEAAPVNAIFLDPGTYWIAAIYNRSVNAYEGTNARSRLYYVSDAYDGKFPDPFGATTPVDGVTVNYYVRLEDSN